jgi:hypothetical protein
METSADVAGFWSYATEDDRLDGGAILRLSELLAHEFELIAGRKLELFVDRRSILWGQEWRQRIDDALATSTFLIPIITPRYFTRPECVRELLDFHGKIRSAGLDRLLLPIIYIDVPGLTPDSDDEVRSIIARTQSVDWRDLRLQGPDSPDHRRAINRLASRIHAVDTEINATQVLQELEIRQEDEEGEGGLDDLIASIDTL